MGMGIGIHSEIFGEERARGRQESVACCVWFTSHGEVMPKMIKFMGEDQELHTISRFQVILKERKHYCGIPAIEFFCRAQEWGREVFFWLFYYPERQEWKILWKKEENTGEIHKNGVK